MTLSYETAKKNNMLCRHCKQKLKEMMGSFDAFSFLSPPMMYCENNECEEFGYVTMVGIPEKKEEAPLPST